MANTEEKKGDRTTFLCGKAQHFLSKIPDAKGVTAHLAQPDAGVTQLPIFLSRTALHLWEGC